MNIKDVYQWNEVAGNLEYNRHLEASMLSEELAEVIIALKNKDKVEAVDGVLDVLFVGLGTLQKLWVSAEEVEACWEEIVASNYSKFTEKNGELTVQKEWGKIIKPPHFKAPDLKSIIK